METPFNSLISKQRHALTLMLNGNSLYLGGRGGTGKTTVLETFAEFTGREKRNVAFLAPTGKAALHIGGSTVHRFFNLPVGCKPEIPPDLPLPEDPRTCDVIANTRTIVLDEVSMIRSDVMAAIERILRSLPLDENSAYAPYGGRQVIAVGDAAQLAPCTDQEELDRLNNRYGGPYAFQTAAWKSAGFEKVVLDSVHRQADPEFIDILDGIRRADPQAVARLNERVTICDPPADGIILTPRLDRAEEINRNRDAMLPGPVYTLDAHCSGYFSEDMMPTTPQLCLRVGSRVMLVANSFRDDVRGFDYVNGDMGRVTGISPDLRIVEVQLDSGRTVQVPKHTWRNTVYTVCREPFTNEPWLHQEDIGWFVQFPLRLGSAVTVHRAQGQGYDRVHIELGAGMFAPGQLYVALSRCRSLDQLSLDRPLNYFDLLQDPRAIQFCEETERSAAATYDKMTRGVMWSC